MNTATESLIRKIKALLAKADPRNNATKEEAEEALRKAQELMTRHGIESMDVEQDKDATSMDHEMYVLSRTQRCDYDQNVSRILSTLFNVGVIFTRVHANNKMCNTYILIGNELDRTIAREALPILLKAMTLGVSKHLRERGLKWTAPVGQSYYLGVENGYIHASAQGQARAYDQAKQHEVDRYALVLVDKQKAIVEYAQQTFKPKPCFRPTDHVKKGQFDFAAYSKGYEDGKDLDLTNTRKLA